MGVTHKIKLDQEWILLLQTAKMMGISAEEVKLFLEKEKAQPHVCDTIHTRLI